MADDDFDTWHVSWTYFSCNAAVEGEISLGVMNTGLVHTNIGLLLLKQGLK